MTQTLKEWSQQTSWGDRFSYICVCSDPKVRLKDDAFAIDNKNAGFRIDTDPEIVRSFLDRQSDDVKVVFRPISRRALSGRARADCRLSILPYSTSHTNDWAPGRRV
jgi:hypothetical protein